MRKIGSAFLHFFGAALFAVMALVEIFAVILNELSLFIEQGSEFCTQVALDIAKPPAPEPAKNFIPVQFVSRRVGNRISEVQP